MTLKIMMVMAAAKRVNKSSSVPLGRRTVRWRSAVENSVLMCMNAKKTMKEPDRRESTMQSALKNSCNSSKMSHLCLMTIANSASLNPSACATRN